jgi:hypothetical protein
METTPIY